MRMLLFILYAAMAAVAFSCCYIGHRKINNGKYLYLDGDSVGFSVLMAVFWPITMWFFGPYLFINLYKKN